MFDETQKMLLVHAGRVMNVRIDLSDIVKVSVWHPLSKSLAIDINVRIETIDSQPKSPLPSNRPFPDARSARCTSSISPPDTAIS